MGIKKTSEITSEGKVTVEIDNGHLEALTKIKNDYNIVDIEKALGFLIAIASKGEGKPIKIGEDSFVPGEGIKNKPTPPPTTSEEVTQKV